MARDHSIHHCLSLAAYNVTWSGLQGTTGTKLQTKNSVGSRCFSPKHSNAGTINQECEGAKGAYNFLAGTDTGVCSRLHILDLLLVAASNRRPLERQGREKCRYLSPLINALPPSPNFTTIITTINNKYPFNMHLSFLFLPKM